MDLSHQSRVGNIHDLSPKKLILSGKNVSCYKENISYHVKTPVFVLSHPPMTCSPWAMVNFGMIAQSLCSCSLVCVKYKSLSLVFLTPHLVNDVIIRQSFVLSHWSVKWRGVCVIFIRPFNPIAFVLSYWCVKLQCNENSFSRIW